MSGDKLKIEKKFGLKKGAFLFRMMFGKKKGNLIKQLCYNLFSFHFSSRVYFSAKLIRKDNFLHFV